MTQTARRGRESASSSRHAETPPTTEGGAAPRATERLRSPKTSSATEPRSMSPSRRARRLQPVDRRFTPSSTKEPVDDSPLEIAAGPSREKARRARSFLRRCRRDRDGDRGELFLGARHAPAPRPARARRCDWARRPGPSTRLGPARLSVGRLGLGASSASGSGLWLPRPRPGCDLGRECQPRRLEPRLRRLVGGDIPERPRLRPRVYRTRRRWRAACTGSVSSTRFSESDRRRRSLSTSMILTLTGSPW